jgi:Na+/melibiose symporter-like transporter
MTLYQIFFVGAFLLGLAEVAVFKRFKTDASESAQVAKAAAFKMSDVKKILGDKKFTKFFCPLMLFMFCWQGAWPIYNIYHIRVLNANEFWFAMYTLASGTGAFVSAGFWQRYIRKNGNDSALVLSAFMLGFNTLLYPLAPNVVVMTLFCTVGGVVTLGFNTAALGGMLGATPDEGRLVYMAFYNTFLGLSLFIAPMLALFLLSVTDIYPVFFFYTGLRLAAAGVLYWKRKKSIPC